MTVRLIIVPKEELPSVELLTDQLVKAVNIGDMSVVDQITNQLLSLTYGNRSLTMIEDSWNDLLMNLRALDKSYRSDYIISDQALITKVLSELKGLSADIQLFLKLALCKECVILQLPLENEVDFV